MGAFSGVRLSTAERLRELAWEGFTLEEIAEAAGCPVDVIQDLYGDGTRYPGACKAVLRAWRRLAVPDIDEIAVERVLDGDYPPDRLTPAERREVIRQLRLCRHTHRQIAEHLAVNPRTVNRVIVSLGLAEQGR